MGGLPHPGLAWLLDRPDGRDWLDRLPGIVEDCVARWDLRSVGEPFAYAMASLALPATLPDGTAAVLKVQFPDRESAQEAEALRRWDGQGAVRLLAHDPERAALLLERAEPGRHLSTIDAAAALEVIAGLLPRLWVEADAPFARLEDEAAGWAQTLDSALAEREVDVPGDLRDAALAAIEELAPTQPERVLVHQDLHGDNVVAAVREPWLAIDPKPLAGERAFALAPVVRSYEFGHSREAALHRLDALSARLGVDRERARRWTLAQAVAWCDDERHLDTARWMAEA